MQIDSKKDGVTHNRRSLLDLRFKLALALAFVVLAVYWPVRHHPFINYDDNVYIYFNPYVIGGFTWEGIVRAFGRIHGDSTYWHPVTWLSHMIDVELFGVNPGPHHLVSVLIHSLNSLLIFLGLNRLTGRLWPSLATGLVFALHPFQVDTVAWAAERKNLLHVFFGLLSTWAYISYVETSRRRAYLLSIAMFALGLMSKPTLVTLPCAFFLLDYWPLRRFGQTGAVLSPEDSTRVRADQQPSLGKIITEKIPFFVMSAASSYITIHAHQQLASMSEDTSIGFRLKNAVVSYFQYLRKAFWPDDLCILYPYRPEIGLKELMVASGVLLLVTGACLYERRRRPFLVIGWFWFLGNLVPAIGIVQAGAQAMADRFVYFPLLGLIAAAVFGVSSINFGHQGIPKLAKVVGIGLVAIVLGVGSRIQLSYWKDTITVFQRALHVTSGNYIAHHAVGVEYLEKRDFGNANKHLFKCLNINPAYELGIIELANSLSLQGDPKSALDKLAEFAPIAKSPLEINKAIAMHALKFEDHVKAVNAYSNVLKYKPADSEALVGLANEQLQAGDFRAAANQFSVVLRNDPFNIVAQFGIVRSLVGTGETNAALGYLERASRFVTERSSPAAQVACATAFASVGLSQPAEMWFLKAIEKQPDNYEALFNLGNLYSRAGASERASEYLARAVKHRPLSADAANNYGVVLASLGNLAGASEQYKAALRLNTNSVDAHYGLARVYEMQTNYSGAATHYAEALRLRPNLGPAQIGLGVVLSGAGRWKEAAAALERYIAANPKSGTGHYHLGFALIKMGEITNGLSHLDIAIQVRPGDRALADSIVRLLATSAEARVRNGPKAVALGEQVCNPIDGAPPKYLESLAAAYAEAGSFEKAKATATRALNAARAGKDEALARTIERHLESYNSGRPIRDGQ